MQERGRCPVPAAGPSPGVGPGRGSPPPPFPGSRVSAAGDADGAVENLQADGAAELRLQRLGGGAGGRRRPRGPARGLGPLRRRHQQVPEHGGGGRGRGGSDVGARAAASPPGAARGRARPPCARRRRMAGAGRDRGRRGAAARDTGGTPSREPGGPQAAPGAVRGTLPTPAVLPSVTPPCYRSGSPAVLAPVSPRYPPRYPSGTRGTPVNCRVVLSPLPSGTPWCCL